MVNRSQCQGNRPKQPSRPPLVPVVHREPPVRRWPHPIEDAAPARETEPTLHYIRCALSYQNQLLAEIKALLQQLTIDQDGPAAP